MGLNTENGSASFRIDPAHHAIHFAGDLRLSHGGAELWRDLVEATRDASGEISLDLSGVDAIDGAVVALLVELRAELAARGVRAELTGTGDRIESLVRLYAGRDEPAQEPGPPRERALANLGRAAARASHELVDELEFVGTTGAAAAAVLRQPRLGHWKQVPSLAQIAGADALPIVLLINGLVGFAMAFQSAKKLELYGANIYVADVVGIAMARELAPLMTAIIVCGRSGAGYAAEIGAMKINEEIDALRTLGIRPVNWLVVPRVVALLLVVPGLTLLADFVGVLGGMVVAVTDLDVTAYGYLLETKLSVKGWDVATGLIKSVVFAVAIVVIACQQGFATTGGAEAVGRRTTSTVVASLFVLVLLDAIVTVIFRVFDV